MRNDKYRPRLIDKKIDEYLTESLPKCRPNSYSAVKLPDL